MTNARSQWIVSIILLAVLSSCHVLLEDLEDTETKQEKVGPTCISDDCLMKKKYDYKVDDLSEEEFDFSYNEDMLTYDLQDYDDFELVDDYDTMTSQKVLGVYARYEQIFEWQRSLCRSYPEVVRVYDIGQSVEGRTMTVLKVGLRAEDKWSIWIDGGIHAREHISPATVVYITEKLLQGYRLNDSNSLQMLTHFDWYILPVVNPDGYEYSHTHDRLWRKNRRKVTLNCTGVDLNRNWNMSWGGADSDPDPCSAMFMGEGPQSEPEVENIVKFLLPRSAEFLAFLTYHSYGQRIFTRWDYTGSVKDPDHQRAVDIANQMAEAIEKSNRKDYTIGQAPQITYSFGGGSADWAKAVAGIRYPFLIELPDLGQFGFLLPPEEILPTGRGQWAAMKRLSTMLNDLHGSRKNLEVKRLHSARSLVDEYGIAMGICDKAKASYLYLSGNANFFGESVLFSYVVPISTVLLRTLTELFRL